jgi:hypothetical protein
VLTFLRPDGLDQLLEQVGHPIFRHFRHLATI